MQLLITQKGAPQIVEVPDPVPAENEVLIETAFSAISPGTELEALSNQSTSVFSMVGRAVLSWDKIKKSLVSRGWRQTLAKIGDSIEKPLGLGYSIAGRVVRVGSRVEEFKTGDWVVAVGPTANHGTMASVPRLMCARIPRPDLARDASVAALACVGIHAMHRAELSGGAEVAIFGLGVIGQLMVQVLRASGYQVVAFDPIESRRSDALRCGTEVHDSANFDFEHPQGLSSHSNGFDAVFICAKTDSPEVMQNAAALCRKRGRLIVVGEFPIQLSRECAYQKELEIRLSAAYGEGRYDPAYEQLDQDYPIEHGRWTIQRNLYLFLQWLQEGRILPSLLGPQVISFTEAPTFYLKLHQAKHVLTLIEYAKVKLPTPSLKLSPRSEAGPLAIPVAVIGAGRFAVETHLPNLSRASDKFVLHTIVGRSPAKTAKMASKFGAKQATCDVQKAYSNSSVAAVLIATPHAQHADHVISALQAGKHIYVEKPLCITFDQLERIQEAYRTSQLSSSAEKPTLFVGFNRRFAPLSQKLLEERVHHRKPWSIRYLFQAVSAPAGDWYDQPEQGGRFIGEACHAVDWILYLLGCPVQSHVVVPGLHGEADIFLQFTDSSRAHLRFQPTWKISGPKEIVEIYEGDTRWVIEDFLHLKTFKRDSPIADDCWKSKGHREALDMFASFIAQPKNGEDPYSFFASSRLTLDLHEKLRAKNGS